MMKYPKWFEKGRIIWCPLDYPYEKKKFCIILGYDISRGEILVALINKGITEFVQQNSCLRELQVELKKSEYPTVFKRTISYVDCSIVRRKNLNRLIEELDRGIAKDYLTLKESDKELIFTKILSSPDVKTKDKLSIRSILPHEFQ